MRERLKKLEESQKLYYTLTCNLEFTIIFTSFTLMNEIWKSLEGFDYDYQVSNTGKVRRMGFTSWMEVNKCTRTYPTKELTLSESSNGYLTFSAYRGGKKFTQFIHRVVAELFITNPNSLKCVCHKDDDKSNNRVENLFWGSNLDNSSDMVTKGRSAKGSKQGSSKLKESDIPTIRSRVAGGESSRSIASDFNVKHTTILDIKNRKTWNHV